MSFAQDVGSLNDAFHFRYCCLFIGNATPGKRAKAAVRVQVNLIGLVVIQCLLRLCDDVIDAFHLAVAGVDDSKPDFSVIQGITDYGKISGPWRRKFEDELIDFQLLQRRNQRLVISRQMHLVLGAPIPAANMDTDLDAIDTIDDAVDKVYCEFEFRTRITAGCQTASHECTAKGLSLLIGSRVDNLRQHRFIKLDKFASCVPELDELFSEDGDYVIGHVSRLGIKLF